MFAQVSQPTRMTTELIHNSSHTFVLNPRIVAKLVGAIECSHRKVRDWTPGRSRCDMAKYSWDVKQRGDDSNTDVCQYRQFNIKRTIFIENGILESGYHHRVLQGLVKKVA